MRFSVFALLPTLVLIFSFHRSHANETREIAEVAAPPSSSKFEELYIWKMSDELKLIPAEEKKFSEFIKTHNKKKSDLNTEMQNHLQQMQTAKTDSEKSKELLAYKKSLQAYNRLSEVEIDSIKTLLGVQRTVKYLEIKQDMTNRLKGLLLNPESKPQLDKPSLPPPKVIEE